ncbi:glycosyltransferase [Propionicimonas sp.]|uniref:MGDG synthase family glycosyltransferase n=1 Tax=Propionicimonas sp. TaxID=1955623 RepID=UPI001833A924|nr:glycosyltransferase [Propionicimonas sp.]MBU3976706.1 glycosyltransferase [Actinomycetota bacterium]MBA3019771.1 glycosyltransferase [Propionicimonas sp.]MBU3986801.1 glycosyltransferase [Actinomycetota bacterium]MBU4006713.1 glycosyltransferase [Actinomycetota bacterium]MBU4065413.1 glycosyltransferase [Actinomycetota bacterium]
MSEVSDSVPLKRVLFLFSDTGGGHRAPTEAMIEALELEFPGRFETRMVDFFRQYYPSPLKYAPELYPPISRVPKAWGLSFKASDGKSRSKAVATLTYPYVRRAISRLLAENPTDLIVSVHPLVNQTLMRAMRRSPRPYLAVVTDLVSTHAFWFDRRADLVVVATEQAKEKAMEYGIAEGNLRVIGLPVRESFNHRLSDPAAWRSEQGWANDRPVILLVSGGDGMGPVKRVAKAISEAGLAASLVVICGRNEELKAELERVKWQLPVHLYGFVSEMPKFMAAADIVVTKAGAGSISEAFICGLPIIIYAKLAGQEDGNVTYVVEHNAGVWAPRPREVTDALRTWIEDPAARAEVAAASAKVARPDAARSIARVIADQLGIR